MLQESPHHKDSLHSTNQIQHSMIVPPRYRHAALSVSPYLPSHARLHPAAYPEEQADHYLPDQTMQTPGPKIPG
ncbi:hypothetical protein RRG08_057624 [Elysia crispata]|uniref:Uncharacterized protein n=1 Tax=Elysia crispata TaxID=231223 RepID=A0AAE1DQQ5_9GAST|nr:hypothetical protein RRG08_057624 [Elysia crispata]